MNDWTENLRTTARFYNMLHEGRTGPQPVGSTTTMYADRNIPVCRYLSPSNALPRSVIPHEPGRPEGELRAFLIDDAFYDMGLPGVSSMAWLVDDETGRYGQFSLRRVKRYVQEFGGENVSQLTIPEGADEWDEQAFEHLMREEDLGQQLLNGWLVYYTEPPEWEAGAATLFDVPHFT